MKSIYQRVQLVGSVLAFLILSLAACNQPSTTDEKDANTDSKLSETVESAEGAVDAGAKEAKTQMGAALEAAKDTADKVSEDAEKGMEELEE